jgi:hypothetical protein
MVTHWAHDPQKSVQILTSAIIRECLLNWLRRQDCKSVYFIVL